MNMTEAVKDMVANFNNIPSGFPLYQNEMNRVANARQAESYYLQQMYKHLNEVSRAHRDTADSLERASGDIKDSNKSLFGELIDAQ
jgi:predicted lipase